MDGKSLHSLLKDHSKDLFMDDKFLGEVVIPSVEKYLDEYKRNIEALISILEEKIAMINQHLEHKCEMSSNCVRWNDRCVTCYRKIIEKLQETIKDL